MTINVDNSLEYKYRQGESITVANLKGAHKFVEEEAKRLNPTYLMRSWNSISK